MIFTPSPLSKLALVAIAIGSVNVQASDMETLVVTAQRGDTVISDIAATMWVIEQEQLQTVLNTGADLKNAIGRLVPSFDFGSEGRTNFAQNLRGRSALVMIDGVSLNSMREISRQLDSIDPFNVARIEVLSGATSIYGAGAAGGIINIITKKATKSELSVETQMSLSSQFEAGDDVTSSLAVAILGGNDVLKGRISAAYSKSEGAFDANGDMILPDVTQTGLQDNTTVDLMGNLQWNVTGKQQLSLSAQYYESKQDSKYGTYLGPNLAGILGYPELIEVREGLLLEEQPSTERSMLTLQYKNADVVGHTLLAQLFHRSEALSFFPFPAIYRVTGSPFPGSSFPLFGASKQETDIHGFQITLNKEAEQLSLNYGIDWQDESFSADQNIFDTMSALRSGGLHFNKIQSVQRYPDIGSTQWAAFAQGQYRISDQWRLNAGIRHQAIEHTVGDNVPVLQQHLHYLGMYPIEPQKISGGKNDYSERMLNVGAVYKIDQNEQLWFNYSEGFNLPDPAKYYGQGQYIGSFGEGPILLNSIDIAGNALSGITTDSIELGWRKAQDKYQLQVVAYYSMSDKTISYDRKTLAVVVNDDKRRIFGIEGQFSYNFTQELYVSLQGHVLNSETETNNDWQNLSAEESSPSSASIHLGYDNLSYGAELQIQNLADYTDAKDFKLKGYSLANVSAYYVLPIGRLNLGIQNLFNKDYETSWSQRAQILYSGLAAPELFTFNGTGTTFTLGYALTF